MRTLRVSFPLLFVLATGLPSEPKPQGRSSDGPASIQDVQTKFHSEAVLTSTELQSVVRLALQCGLPNVAKIETYNIHPSPDYDILAKSRETVRGREVSFFAVHINFEKWMPERARSRQNVLASDGEFWVKEGSLYRVELTIFYVNGTAIRVQLHGNTPLPLADKIVAAFAAGKVRYVTEKVKEQVKEAGANLSKPGGISLGNDGKTFHVSFSLGDLAVMNLKCVFENDLVMVIDLNILIS